MNLKHLHYFWVAARAGGIVRAGEQLHTTPQTLSVGKNSEPFPYPFVLPDSSGVIFNAGWPGPEHGVYLAEWPAALP